MRVASATADRKRRGVVDVSRPRRRGRPVASSGNTADESGLGADVDGDAEVPSIQHRQASDLLAAMDGEDCLAARQERAMPASAATSPAEAAAIHSRKVRRRHLRDRRREFDRGDLIAEGSDAGDGGVGIVRGAPCGSCRATSRRRTTPRPGGRRRPGATPSVGM